MAASGYEHVGVFVVRAWVEPADKDNPLRARVTTIKDAFGPGGKETVLTSSVDEICDVLREWAAALVEAEMHRC